MPRTDDERIAALKTTRECEILARNAKERDRGDLARRAERRQVELAADAEGAESPIEVDAWRAIHAYEQTLFEKHGKHQRASYTRRAIDKHGVIKAVENTVVKGGESKGYQALVDKGMADLLFEAVILRHPERFSGEAVDIARKRLEANEEK